jgi:hypothetical protein
MTRNTVQWRDLESTVIKLEVTQNGSFLGFLSYLLSNSQLLGVSFVKREEHFISLNMINKLNELYFWTLSTWVFPWLLVFQGVCGCACALVCMRYLCFPGFNRF